MENPTVQTDSSAFSAVKSFLPRKKWLVISSLLLFIILLSTQGLSLYYQVAAGGMITDSIDRINSGVDGVFTCNQVVQSNQKETALLTRAIAYLERSVRLSPWMSHPDLLMGRANCLLGRPVEAVSAYNRYIILRSENPLGQLELGFAYKSLCSDASAISEEKPESMPLNVACQDENLNAIIVRNWQAAGVTPEQMYSRADQEFALQRYDEAQMWFENAVLLGWKPDANRQFRWAVSNVLGDRPLSGKLDPAVIPIYKFIDNFKIDGADLQWLRLDDPSWVLHNGEQLRIYPISGDDPAIGAMWYQGSAVFFVQAPCDSTYRITVMAKHSSPLDQVGELQIEKDLISLGKFSVSDDWKSYTVETNLEKGTHLLGITFVKDIGDLFIQWVRVEKTAACQP